LNQNVIYFNYHLLLEVNIDLMEIHI
jgi:hypothetical protein